MAGKPAILTKTVIRPKPASIVAIDLFAALVAFLRLDRQSRDRACVEALQRDRLTRLLAIAIGTLVDTLQGGIDLGDQFALTVARPELDRPVCLRRCTVGQIGMICIFLLQDFESFSRRISFFQVISFCRKYDFCRSFMNGSSSEGM